MFIGTFLFGSFLIDNLYLQLIIAALIMTVISHILVDQSEKITQLNKRLNELENKEKDSKKV